MPDSDSTVGGLLESVAASLGIPPEVALAVGFHESGLNPTAVGDQGTSFGIYQLHKGGELGNLSTAAAFDVYTNAMTALPVLAKQRKAHPSYTWGQVAAAAQRPANPGAYASTVDSLLTGYHHSGQAPLDYFGRLSHYAKLPISEAYKGAPPDAATPFDQGPAGATGSPGSGTPATAGGNVADDWIGTIDKLLNPSGPSGLGILNPFSDTKYVAQLALFRGGFAIVGLTLIGAGLLIAFGRDILGGALLAIPGAGEAEAAASVETRAAASQGATVAKKAADQATREATAA